MYVINYNTGVVEKVEGTLEEVKQRAYEGMAYTGHSVNIEDEEGTVVSQSVWWGVLPEEHDEVLVQIANGFYQEWEDNF